MSVTVGQWCLGTKRRFLREKSKEPSWSCLLSRPHLTWNTEFMGFQVQFLAELLQEFTYHFPLMHYSSYARIW